MKRILIFLLTAQTILGFSPPAIGVDCCGQGHTEYSADGLLFRDIMYTTEGDLLLRHVVDPKEKWFRFQECMLVPSKTPSREGHTIGACYNLSPKYYDTSASRMLVGNKFARYLHHDLRSVQYVQKFSKWVLPFLTFWAVQRSFVEWSHFYAPAFAAVRFRTGVMATLLSIATSIMGAAVWNAWTSDIPSVESSLRNDDPHAEKQTQNALKGEDIYLLIRTALRQTFADPAINRYRIVEQNSGFGQ